MRRSTFIIGAGFTRSVFPDAPLNDDLVKDVLREVPASNICDLCNRYQTKDIELVLTRFAVDTEFNVQRKFSMMKGVSCDIAKVVRKFRFKEAILTDHPWLRDFAERVIMPYSTIVNLNYDCLLDGLLFHLNVWRPGVGSAGNGYGGVTGGLPTELNNQNPNSIQILKIHGSENFTFREYDSEPESPSLMYEFNPDIFGDLGKQLASGYTSVAGSEALLASEKVWPCLIAPSYIKIPSMKISQLMNKSIQGADLSDNLIVIGCSLRKEDTFLWQLITAFLLGRSTSGHSKRLIVVDPGATEIRRKLGAFFGNLTESKVMAIEQGLEDSVDNIKRLLCRS